MPDNETKAFTSVVFKVRLNRNIAPVHQNIAPVHQNIAPVHQNIALDTELHQNRLFNYSIKI